MREDSPPSFRDRSGPAPADDRLLGHTIASKFLIEGRLGAGAMGTVYRARQLALDKTVAVKVLNGGLAADPTFAERFRREAKAASRLDHANSIRVFDFGQDTDGLLYLVMEYVEGRDLRAVLSEMGPLAPAGVVEVLCQVLAALSVAHDMGVMHRDLKPENIMVVRGVGDDGQPVDVVKVCDFGIAKIVNQPVPPTPEGRRTSSGVVVGTPEYMSPEQARGEAVDGRSDVYSVGVVLYELLAGVPPFDGTSALNIVLKHIGEAPPPPSLRRPGVSAALETICLRAMEKRPADRFQTARDMRRALLACGDASPSTAGPRVLGPMSASGRTPSQRAADAEKPTLGGVAPLASVPIPRRARSWLAVGALLAVALAAGVLTLRRPPPPPPPGTPSAAPVSAAIVAPDPLVPGPAPVVLAAPEPSAEKVEPRTHKKKPSSPAGSTSATPAPAAPAVASDFPEPLPAPATVPAPVTVPPLPPVPEPEPVAVASPVAAPAPVAVAAPAPAPPYDLARARVDLGPAVDTVGVTSASLSRTVSEAASALDACYRASLPRLGAPYEGHGTLHVETDGDGVITDARVAWGSDPALAPCMTRAIVGRRVANVDTGNASADIPLTFRAR